MGKKVFFLYNILYFNNTGIKVFSKGSYKRAFVSFTWNDIKGSPT